MRLAHRRQVMMTTQSIPTPQAADPPAAALLQTPPQVAAVRVRLAHGPARRHIVVPFLLACIFAACFVLYTRHNDFPAYYHDDEADKAAQIIRRDRNFNHPQLMLEGTQLLAAARHTPPEIQATVETGRAASAALAALGVVAMALAGFRLHGFPGLLVTALAVGLCPALVVYAHYMKEDASLIAGMGLCVLAAQVAWPRRERTTDAASLCFLGAACGLAASGKYTGAFTLAVAVPFAMAWGRPGRKAAGMRALLLVLAAAAFFLLVNHRAFGHFATMGSRLNGERRQTLEGLWGFRLSRPNLYHATIFVHQCMPHVIVLVGIYVALLLARRIGRGFDLFLVVLAGGYLAMISFSAVPFNRYVLPVVVLAHLAAGMAVLRLRELVHHPLPRGAVWGTGAALILALQLPRCLDYSSQFANDSRERLRAWVAANLPSDAVIVQDGYVGLQEPFDPRLGRCDRPEIRLYGSRSYGCGQSAADAGDLDVLRRLGVDYVAVTDTEYNWYLDVNVKSNPDGRATFADRRRWYQDLFRDGQLVWRCAPAHPTFSQYNNPEIRLYRLQRGE
ncbi:MAG TPA: hypothetical protein VG269_19205 [Tepidisphaeraceae bacterium]|nr:hypothetical protein [Tepidisphaeraceae bacterium]